MPGVIVHLRKHHSYGSMPATNAYEKPDRWWTAPRGGHSQRPPAGACTLRCRLSGSVHPIAYVAAPAFQLHCSIFQILGLKFVSAGVSAFSFRYSAPLRDRHQLIFAVLQFCSFAVLQHLGLFLLW